MSVARTVIRVFGARTVSSLVAFVAFVVFARKLGASSFGIFVLFQALITFLGAFVDLGIDEAVEKRISEVDRGESAADLLTTAIVVETALVVLFAVGILLARPFVNDYVGAEIALLLIPVLLFHQLGWLLLHTLRGELSVDRSALFEVIYQLTFLLVGYFLVSNGFGVKGVIYGYGIGWFVLCVVSFYALSTGLGSISVSAARSLSDFSKYNFIASVLRTSAYSWIDVLLIGVFLSQSAVAAYEAAWRVTLAVMLFAQAIGHTLFPQVSDWISREKLAEVERVVPTAITGSLLLVVPSVAGAFVLGEDILTYLFGSEYAIASTALVVLLIGKIVAAVNNVYRPVLLGLDRPDLAAWSAIVFIGLNSVLNVVLVWRFGLVGAAVATSIAFGVYTGMNKRYLGRYIDLRANMRELTAVLFASGVMAVLLWGFRRAVPIESLLHLLGFTIAGATAYALVLLVTPPFRDRFLQYLAEQSESPL